MTTYWYQKSTYYSLIHKIFTDLEELVLRFLMESQGFLQFIESHEIMENTIVLLLSDHGLHYGPYFQTLPGRKVLIF